MEEPKKKKKSWVIKRSEAEKKKNKETRLDRRQDEGFGRDQNRVNIAKIGVRGNASADN